MAMLRPPFWLRANGVTCRVFAGNDLGAGSCYAEVVIEDCYRLFKYSRKAKPLVIADIGANVGVFSKLCTLLFPQAEIYAYEPNPTALKYLEQNAAGTSIKVIPCAVGENSGLVSFNVDCDTTLSQVTADGNIRVKCIAASDVAEGRQIDLLKMDCEGSEWSILRDTTLLGRTRDACLEYHLHNKHTLDELKSLISRANHEILSIGHIKNEGEFGVVRTRLIT
jgi:FkbM family methyltransferase